MTFSNTHTAMLNLEVTAHMSEIECFIHDQNAEPSFQAVYRQRNEATRTQRSTQSILDAFELLINQNRCLSALTTTAHSSSLRNSNKKLLSPRLREMNWSTAPLMFIGFATLKFKKLAERLPRKRWLTWCYLNLVAQTME